MSVCRILALQQIPKLGRPKPLTGPHAARRLDITELEDDIVISTLITTVEPNLRTS